MKYPNMWAIIGEKGYQGGSNFIRIIHPKKKPPGGLLSATDVEENRKISSDRIIVENYFGRFVYCGGIYRTNSSGP